MCPFDELHCLQGFVNHVFWDGLVKEIGNDKAKKWPEKLNLTSKGYHGQIFEGNACRKLLNNASGIFDLDADEVILRNYYNAFTAYNNLVSNLFSSSKVSLSNDIITELLNTAVENYLSLKITITLKVHVVFNHVQDMLARSYGLGLGLFSAQAVESSHREFFDKFWSKYKVESINNPRFSDRLLKACVEFTSKHK